MSSEKKMNADSSFTVRIYVDQRLSTFTCEGLSQLVTLLPSFRERHEAYVQGSMHDWEVDLSQFAGMGFSMELERDPQSEILAQVSELGWQITRLRPAPIRVYPKPSYFGTKQLVVFTPPEWDEVEVCDLLPQEQALEVISQWLRGLPNALEQ